MGSCAGNIGKLVLVSLNGVILLGGLGLLVAGVVVQVDKSIISDHVLPLVNGIELSGFNLGDLISNLSITCIAVGCFLSVLAGLGVFGACCRVKFLLFLYGLIVVLIIVAQLVAVVMWFLMHDKLNTWLKEQLFTLIQRYDGDVTNEISLAWDWFFILMPCCGVNAVTTTNDFANTTWWTSPQRYSQQIPPSCCVGATSSNMASYVNSTCTTSPSNTNSYWNDGCYDKMYTSLSTYSTTFIVICVVIAAVEVIAVFFAFKVYQNIKNNVDAS
ncbi:hypothetical protein ScPMuIL_003051 [Solemya velum]